MKVLKPHVSLNVANVDASVAFYEKVFPQSLHGMLLPWKNPESVVARMSLL